MNLDTRIYSSKIFSHFFRNAVIENENWNFYIDEILIEIKFNSYFQSV